LEEGEFKDARKMEGGEGGLREEKESSFRYAWVESFRRTHQERSVLFDVLVHLKELRENQAEEHQHRLQRRRERSA